MVIVGKKISSASKNHDDSSLFYVPTILEEESSQSTSTKLTKIPKYKDCQRQLDLFLALRKKNDKASFLSPTGSKKRCTRSSPVIQQQRQGTPISPESIPKYKDFQRQLGLCISIRKGINNDDVSPSIFTPSGKSASFVTPTSVGTTSSSTSSSSKLSSVPRYKEFQRELDLCLSVRENGEEPSFVITPTTGSVPSSRGDDDPYFYDDDIGSKGMHSVSFQDESAHTSDSNCSSSILEDFHNESCLGASAIYQNQSDQPTICAMDSFYFPSFLFNDSQNNNTMTEERNNNNTIVSVGSTTVMSRRQDQSFVREDESTDSYYNIHHHDRSYLESSVTTRRVDDILLSRDYLSSAKEDESEDTYFILRHHESSFILPSDAVPTTNEGKGIGDGVPEYIFIPSCNSCEFNMDNESNLPTPIEPIGV